MEHAEALVVWRVDYHPDSRVGSGSGMQNRVPVVLVSTPRQDCSESDRYSLTWQEFAHAPCDSGRPIENERVDSPVRLVGSHDDEFEHRMSVPRGGPITTSNGYG